MIQKQFLLRASSEARKKLGDKVMKKMKIDKLKLKEFSKKYWLHTIALLLLVFCAFLFVKNWNAIDQIHDLKAKISAVDYENKNLLTKVNWLEVQIRANAEADARALAQAQAEANAKAQKMELATVADKKQGEGVENPFTRQITDDPEFFGFEADEKNSEPSKVWVSNKSDEFAKHFGFINFTRDGTQIGIKKAGIGKPALVLDKDEKGNFICKVFVKDANGNFPDTPVQVLQYASSTSATFLATADEEGNYTVSNTLKAFFYVLPEAQP